MKLNYSSYSQSGEALVILHGLFGSHKNWNRLAGQLAENFAVYSLDLRNHGESPHADSMDYPVMAEDVVEFLDHQGIQSCLVLGHSMGGKVAMQLALSYPDRVSKLIAVDIAPINYSAARGDHDEVFAGLDGVDLSKIESRKQADAMLAHKIHDTSVRQFLLTNLERAEQGAYQWRFNIASLKKNYDKLRAAPKANSSFDKPALFLKGALSNYIREVDEEKILALFPRAKIIAIEGAGHWLHAEKPAELLALVEEFLVEEDA